METIVLFNFEHISQAVFHVVVAISEVLTPRNNEFHLRLGRSSRGVTFTLVTEYGEEESPGSATSICQGQKHAGEACCRKQAGECTRSYSAVFMSSYACTHVCACTYR